MKLPKELVVKIGFLTVVAGVLISWGILHSSVLPANVTASWSYDYSQDPACSSTRTINCIDHFEVEDITDQQKIKIIRYVGNPTSAIGKVANISVSFEYGPPFGQRSISVIAVGRDSKDNRVTSNPFAARVTVTIRPGTKMSLLF